MKTGLLLFVCFICTLAMAHASDVSAPVLSVGDKIMAFLNGISPQVMLVVVGAIEFALRALKTKKPLSVIRGIIATGKYVCNVILSVLSFLDKIIPQNVEEFSPAVQQKLK
jgi:hypothetical protein